MYFVFSFKACFLLEICIFLSPINTNHCSGGSACSAFCRWQCVNSRGHVPLFQNRIALCPSPCFVFKGYPRKSINIIIKKKIAPTISPSCFLVDCHGFSAFCRPFGCALAAASQSQGCDWLRRRPTDELRQLCRVAGLPIPAFPSPDVFFLFCTMWHSRFPSQGVRAVMRFFTTVCFRCGVRWGGAATFMSLCTGKWVILCTRNGSYVTSVSR